MNRLLYRKRSKTQYARQYLLTGITGLMVLSIMAACQTEEEKGEPDQVEKKITFNSSVVSVLSRGTPITKEDQTTLLSAGVYAYSTGTGSFDAVNSTPDYMDNQLLERSLNGSTFTEWTYSPARYWPAAGNKLTFLAYAPHDNLCSGLTLSQQVGTAYPKMDFSVNTMIKDQVDLLIADPAKDCDRSSGTTVALNMQHALTQLTFSAAVDDASNAAGKVQMLSIKLKGIRYQGSTSMNTSIAWATDLSNRTDYELSIANGLLRNTTLSKDMELIIEKSGVLLLMPQKFTDITHGIIEVIFGVKENPDETSMVKTFYLSDFTFDEQAWKPGRALNYQISFDSGLINLTVTLKPWQVMPAIDGGDDGLLPWD